MPHYVGQPLLVTVNAKGYDGETLGPAQVAGLVFELYRPRENSNLGDLVIGPLPVVWNAAKSRWEVEIDTTGLEPGTYKGRSLLTGTEGLDVPTPEFTRLRLAAQPVTPA
jgi:hypothetical protein